jgi:uncharacterized C2H2 Zn-finger protein
VVAVTVNLTAAQAKALGLNVTTRTKTTRKAATNDDGPYHTRCTSCGDEFTVQAAENRHVADGHNRFEIIP